MRIRGLLLTLFLSAGAHADPPAPVPETLFGVKLGAIYKAGDADKEVGTFPVAALTGMKPAILGQGSQVYFRPLTENKRFPYTEFKKTADAQYFNTTFRLYVWPVLTPELIKAISSDEASDSRLTWEVGLVEWSDKAKDASAAYAWAMDTCKDFSVDLGRQPKVVDLPDANLYSCKFTSDEREFEINNISEIRILRLSFVESVTKKKEAALEASLRKIRMNQTRPY